MIAPTLDENASHHPMFFISLILYCAVMIIQYPALMTMVKPMMIIAKIKGNQ